MSVRDISTTEQDLQCWRRHIKRPCIGQVEDHIVRQCEGASLAGETVPTRATAAASTGIELIAGYIPTTERHARPTNILQ